MSGKKKLKADSPLSFLPKAIEMSVNVESYVIPKCCDHADGCDECVSVNSDCECADCCGEIHQNDVETNCAGACVDCGKEVCEKCWEEYFDELDEDEQDELDGDVRCASCRTAKEES